MEINYETLTADQLERYVELVDWIKVPDHLITQDIIDNFASSFPMLQVKKMISECEVSYVYGDSERNEALKVYHFTHENCRSDHFQIVYDSFATKIGRLYFTKQKHLEIVSVLNKRQGRTQIERLSNTLEVSTIMQIFLRKEIAKLKKKEEKHPSIETNSNQ